eukprot:53128-Prymnesium_polylepis.1
MLVHSIFAPHPPTYHPSVLLLFAGADASSLLPRLQLLVGGNSELDDPNSWFGRLSSAAF